MSYVHVIMSWITAGPAHLVLGSWMAWMEARREGKREGYAVEFVHRPPKELQTECSVCLQVLSQPKMVDCCGYRFCSSCLSQVELSFGRQQLCPLCGQPFTSMPDKQLERTLSGFEVYCSHRQKGCRWRGRLGSLSEHLNEKPRSEQDLLQGCPLQAVKCPRCRSPCQRSLMDDHIKTKCSRRDLDCHFKYAGCDVRKPKPELQKHLKEAVSTHLSLATGHIHNLITQQEIDVQVTTQNMVAERNSEIRAVKVELASLRRKHDECLKRIDELKMQVQTLLVVVVVLVVGVIAITYGIFTSS